MRRLSSLFALLIALALTAGAQRVDLPTNADSVRFAAIGDMGTGGRTQYDVAQRMAQSRQTFPFDFVIMMGDNIYGSESPSNMRKKFETPYKTLLDGGIEFYASLGNHDETNQRFYQHFNMNGKRYYTFKKGNVRFFALDSNYMDPEQLAWLERELKGSGSDWKIAYFHHPLYSSGTKHGSSTELRSILEPLFVKYGVDVVFQGHEHVYERIKPQNGIHYFTEGASGKLRKGGLRKSDLTAAGFDADTSFMLVEIAGDELHFQTFSRTGKSVDLGVIHRNTAAHSAADLPAEKKEAARNTPRSKDGKPVPATAGPARAGLPSPK
ncbi:MAG TPA: metallophosphoesterase [Terriglobales bacterium]|nr:metallophosphoesterase [Terriglobales bacterium]